MQDEGHRRLDPRAPWGYACAMSDRPTPRRRLGPFHWAVVAVWAVVASWLIFSIAGAVVKALFFGDGPVRADAAAADVRAMEQPAAAPGDLRAPDPRR